MEKVLSTAVSEDENEQSTSTNNTLFHEVRLMGNLLDFIYGTKKANRTNVMKKHKNINQYIYTTQKITMKHQGQRVM